MYVFFSFQNVFDFHNNPFSNTKTKVTQNKVASKINLFFSWGYLAIGCWLFWLLAVGYILANSQKPIANSQKSNTKN
jgi:hypothetical protein